MAVKRRGKLVESEIPICHNISKTFMSNEQPIVATNEIFFDFTSSPYLTALYAIIPKRTMHNTSVPQYGSVCSIMFSVMVVFVWGAL